MRRAMIVVLICSLGGCGRDGRDGRDGAGGVSGANGRDGRTALLRLSAEPPGAGCAAGGTTVGAGIDDDGDGVLGDTEVQTTSLVCSGRDGTGSGPLRVTDRDGVVVGELAGMDHYYGTMAIRDADGNLWSLDGNGSFDNSLNASFYFTSTDCSGTAHFIPSAIGFMLSDGTNVYRYGGALGTSQIYLSRKSRSGCTAENRTTATFAPYELFGPLPVPAAPPLSIVR